MLSHEKSWMMAKSLVLTLAFFSVTSLAVAAAEPQVSCIPEPTVMNVTHGDIVTCAIDAAADVDQFRFTGSPGDIVRVMVLTRSGSGIACAQLLDPTGTPFPGNWCNNAREFTLAKQGIHTINVNEGQGNQPVSYKLTLARMIPSSPTTRVIEFAETITEEISPDGDLDFYAFNGEAGDQVRIELSTQLGPGLPCAELRDNAGLRVGIQGWCNGVRVLTLQKQGTHTIFVDEAGRDQEVTYNIRIECISGPCTTIPPMPLLTKAGVFRNGQWFVDNGNGKWDGCGDTPEKDRCGSFGLPGDRPVVGDWDGTGRIKVGVFRNGQWFLDNGNLQWDGCGDFPGFDRCGSFGLPGDEAIVGDWDSSGRTKVGVYREGGGWYHDNGNLIYDGCGNFPDKDRCDAFGLAGDVPKSGRWSVFP